MRVVSLDELKQRVAPILTSSETEMPNEIWQTLITDGCRFYGASLYLQSLVDNRSAIRISMRASKGFADAFLCRKHGVTQYYAHSAMNACTHHNLPAVDMAGADLGEFAEEDFFKYYQSLTNYQPKELINANT